MDLPALFTPESAAEAKYLVIVVTDSYVQSALWRFGGTRVELIEKSDLHPYADQKDSVVQTDISLQELGKESEGVDEVIFGLEPHWVHQGDIADQKKPFLKQITQELSLNAIGFVVTIEALHQYLVKTQPQLSALIVQSENAHLRVSFVRQGVLIKTEVVGKSGNLVADMTEALARWTNPEDLAAAYPSRILLLSDQLGEEEVTAEEQMILSHDWVTEKVFLHPPIVEVLKGGTLLEAVVNEGGKAVAQIEGVAIGEPTTAAQTQKPIDNDELAIPVPPPTEVVTASSFGIPLPAESAVVQGSQSTPVAEMHSDDLRTPVPPLEPSQGKVHRQSRWPAFFRHRRHGHYSHRPYILAGLGLGLILLAIVGYSFLRLRTQVVVGLTLKTLPVSEEVTINLDASANSSGNQLSLAAERLEQDFTKTKTIPTTGLKTIGDKAKGTVTLFNKTTSPKTFAAGTTLSSGKLQFTLDEEVTVASASVVTSGSSETKTFGSLDTAATAVEIGVESNIAKNLELKLANFDSGTYAAQSKTEFTGGASREVRVVAEVDRQKILAELRNDVITDAAATFKQSSQGSTYTVPSGKLTLKTSTYSAKTGDEAETLSLDVVATVEGLKYQADQLKPLALATLATKVPATYEIKPESLQILSEAQPPTGTGAAQVTVAANLSAQAVPTLDQAQLKMMIAGQSLARAEEILLAEQTVTKVVTTFSPTISRWIIGSLPPAERLQIEVR